MRPVTVGIPTFRREEQLALLLSSLIPLVNDFGRGEFSAAAVSGAVRQPREVSIVVADNSPDGSAREVVDAAQVASGGDIVRYVQEPRPGVALVRNAIMDNALPDGYLACIDDDEQPTETWLPNLVAAAERSGAAAVSGAVEFILSPEAEPWVRDSGHFDLPDRVSGQELVGAGAGNLLLDLRQLRDMGVRFDPAYSLTGGEDSRLCRDIRLAGGIIIAAPESVVTEEVPFDRGGTREWVLDRSRRFGESWARVRTDLRPSEFGRGAALRRPLMTARGFARFGRGMADLVRARIARDPKRVAQAELYVAGARGIMRGAWNVNHAEYGSRRSS